MKLKSLKASIFLLITSGLLAGCGNALNIPEISEAPVSINLAVSSANLNSVFPVSQKNNGGLSRIIQRKNKEFVLVYGSEKYGDKHIYLTNSPDAKAWQTPVRINSGGLSETNPSIIEDKDGKLRVFYSSNQNGDWEIMQTTSTDGKKWSTPLKLNLDYQGVYNPHVIENHNGEFIIIYQTMGSGIFVSKSSDGIEWTTSEVSGSGTNPCLQILNDGSYVAVYEKQKNIFLQKSSDLFNWSAAVKTSEMAEAKNPSLSMSGNNLVLTYTAKDSTNNWNIYSQKSETVTKWSGLTRLTSNNFNNTKPSIFTNKNMSVLSWTVESNQTLNEKAIYVGVGF